MSYYIVVISHRICIHFCYALSWFSVLPNHLPHGPRQVKLCFGQENISVFHIGIVCVAWLNLRKGGNRMGAMKSLGRTLWLYHLLLWIHLGHLPIFLTVTSLAPGQSYDCPGASEVTFKNMGNIDWYLTATKHNKVRTMWKFVMMYSTTPFQSWYVNGEGDPGLVTMSA